MGRSASAGVSRHTPRATRRPSANVARQVLHPRTAIGAALSIRQVLVLAARQIGDVA